MDVFFDEEVEKEISKKINDLIFINEVNHIVCRSSTFDQNKTDYAEIEGNVERDGAYKIKVDQIYPINGFIDNDGISTPNWKSAEKLMDLWLDTKKILFFELDELAGRGENKYGLNSYFKYLFELFDFDFYY